MFISQDLMMCWMHFETTEGSLDDDCFQEIATFDHYTRNRNLVEIARMKYKHKFQLCYAL